jgi:16S rRNA processing protein RimM
MKNFISIGKLVATFGVAGEFILKHHLGKKTSLKGLEAVFIEQHKDEMLPYFIESTIIKSDDELYIKIEGINSKESARILVQKQVWLYEEDFQKFAKKTAPVSLLGFHVNNEGENLGEILEVIEQPHQVLCRISLDGKEALIPIHQETLKKIDKKNRTVFVVLPEGLLDVFR